MSRGQAELHHLAVIVRDRLAGKIDRDCEVIGGGVR
jgi:hypothetical protein